MLQVLLLFATVLGGNTASAFQLTLETSRVASANLDVSADGSRRKFLDGMAVTMLGSLTWTAVPALASGGATAGGAYLLSAKQRYNDRVSKGVAGFLSLKSLLESGSLAGVREFFMSEDAGSWKDFSTSGYLLANAFRRNSSAAPDTLPAVKVSRGEWWYDFDRYCLNAASRRSPQKWKAFAAEVEAMTKSLKKKDAVGALAEYQAALVALDEYLEKVEIPPAK